MQKHVASYLVSELWPDDQKKHTMDGNLRVIKFLKFNA